MVQEHAGIGTAKRLRAEFAPQWRLLKLRDLGGLFISMEAIMLRDRYRPLFTDQEIDGAHKRLSELGYLQQRRTQASAAPIRATPPSIGARHTHDPACCESIKMTDQMAKLAGGCDV